MYGTSYRFQEEDATDGTSFAPFDPGRSTQQFLPSKHHNCNKCGYESAPTQSKRRRPFHKTTALILASRLLQIGDDKGPHTDDVGYNIHKMGHTQVVGQDGLFQSGARGHPIASLGAFQSVDDKFGHGKPVQATEHTGSCPLQTPFKHLKSKERVVN